MNKSSRSAKPNRKPDQRTARSEDSWLRPKEIQLSCNQFFATRGLRLELNQLAELSDTSPADLDERFHQW